MKANFVVIVSKIFFENRNKRFGFFQVRYGKGITRLQGWEITNAFQFLLNISEKGVWVVCLNRLSGLFFEKLFAREYAIISDVNLKNQFGRPHYKSHAP